MRSRTRLRAQNRLQAVCARTEPARGSDDPAPPGAVITVGDVAGLQQNDMELAIRSRVNVALRLTLENHGITTMQLDINLQLIGLKNLGAVTASSRDSIVIPKSTLRASVNCINDAELCMQKAFISIMMAWKKRRKQQDGMNFLQYISAHEWTKMKQKIGREQIANVLLNVLFDRLCLWNMSEHTKKLVASVSLLLSTDSE